jgi:iron complex outermembrane receptor protein
MQMCKRRIRSVLLCGAGLTAIILAPNAAGAQVTTAGTTASASDAGGAPGDIVVTGTRVQRDGFQAPTPTTVVGAELIAAKAPANIADLVNMLPSVIGSDTPRNQYGAVSRGVVGLNDISLRGLGAGRTLVLLDGQRVGASTPTNLVDINNFPEQLVKRIDVVTGGASAGYGSDAVAGVVNFVLDKTFKGIKGEAQGGVTTYGDDRNYKLTLTAGAAFADDRGHVLLSVADSYNAGVFDPSNRDWIANSKLIYNNPAYTATNGQPRLIARLNSGLATATPGGIITAGPLRGTYFGPGGVPLQFNYGSVVSGNFMTGGQSQYTPIYAGSTLDPRLSRQNLFFRTSFDVTDHVTIFAQASYGRAAARTLAGYQLDLGTSTIRADNAFIPASIAAQMRAQNLTSLTLGTWNQDLGGIVGTTKRKNGRYVLGASGDFQALGSKWNWDVYGQRSVTDTYLSGRTSISANYAAALDSVINPATGAAVCRSTLTNPGNGCVAYNPFGTGVNSQAALNYILGTAWGRNHLTQNVASATLHGNPFSTWAGPVSIATGIEYRKEGISGSNDPISSIRGYYAGNYLASFGSYDVTEGFFETVVPLAKGLPFADSLDLDGAVRETSYSTSGLVTTWKAGLTYAPVRDIRFRATRSRDIRAPNLSDLYQAGTTQTTQVSDPSQNGAVTTAFQVTTGNRSLKPEVADTTGLGVVLQPRFLPGFSASVDYYNIRIKDAITTFNAQQVVNLCAQGSAAFCSSVIRTGGAITSTVVQPVNVARQISRGLDFEASYRRRLDTIAPFLKGNLALRVVATRYLKSYSNNGVTPATDNVGTNNNNGNAGLSLPKWRYLATAGWENDALSIDLTARGLTGGVNNTSYIQCTTGCPTSTAANMTIDDNHIAGATYFDASIRYRLPWHVEMFLAVDNLANKAPATVGVGPSLSGVAYSVNPTLYDTLGRTFRAGFRFKL